VTRLWSLSDFSLLIVQRGLEDNDLGGGLQEGEEPQYKDEIDYLKQLVVKEGPTSFYSGLVPQLLSFAPEKVCPCR
jgi:hypothetical protein